MEPYCNNDDNVEWKYLSIHNLVDGWSTCSSQHYDQWLRSFIYLEWFLGIVHHHTCING
jgi:hypothetical protein